MQFEINYLAVLASGVAMMILGSVWYGPLFGKAWAKLSGAKEMKGTTNMQMAKSYGMMFAAALVLSYVFDHILIAFQTTDVSMALQGVFWTWLGLIAASMIGGYIFGQKPWKLYFIDIGYYLVALTVIGIILTVWR